MDGGVCLCLFVKATVSFNCIHNVDTQGRAAYGNTDINKTLVKYYYYLVYDADRINMGS